MRIWDVPAGYLSRQSLLGEHRELHGLDSILVHGKKGYSRHPETLRWMGCRAALCRRHDLLVAEMVLRGYVDRSPITRPESRLRWPRLFVTAPADQYVLLGIKYGGRDAGRISLPRNAQELWAQHKYSVMARDPELYRQIGRRVARMGQCSDYADLAADLVSVLRSPPPRRRLWNALEHMWGYVRGSATRDDRTVAAASPAHMLSKTRELALRGGQPYLIASTALSELAVFV